MMPRFSCSGDSGRTKYSEGTTVCSGDLESARQADVAIVDGTIATIGELSRDARLVVDAAGHVVAPGFIDIHSHSDYTLLVDPRAMSAIYQGVTLEVVGNCGFGCAPIAKGNHAKDGIYGFDDSVSLDWRDFTGYFGKLAARQPTLNVMSLVPKGQIRRAVVHHLDAPASPAECKEMADLLEQGLSRPKNRPSRRIAPFMQPSPVQRRIRSFQCSSSF